jgi:hypothetical protein
MYKNEGSVIGPSNPDLMGISALWAQNCDDRLCPPIIRLFRHGHGFRGLALQNENIDRYIGKIEEAAEHLYALTGHSRLDR